jgi:TIGR03009 family protein
MFSIRRAFVTSLAASLLFGGPVVLAQSPAAVPANPVAADPLLDLLRQWEQAMNGLRAAEGTVVRTSVDGVTNDRREFVGTIKLLRNPDRFDLDLKRKDKPEVYERFLFTGPVLYEFVPSRKLVRAHQVPPPPAGQPATDDGFLGLLSGTSAKEMLRRYDVQLLSPDAYYQKLILTPRSAADPAQFAKARLALWRDSLLPRQVDFLQRNDDRIVWDIPKIDTNPRLGPTDFIRPTLQPGWHMEQVPLAAAGPAGSKAGR